MMDEERMARRVSIMEIERFAIHDGPGVRTLVFLQGCPLHCSWCSNPESQQMRPHLLYLRNKCVGCGACVNACPNQAITFNNHQPVFNRERCHTCQSCANVCLQNAIRFVGEEVSIGHIMDIIRRDKAYYADSGGGVTVSGGEAFVQFNGLIDLLSACREEGIHTAVETSGQVQPEKIHQALPLIDLFLFDIKHLDRTLLKKETGAHLDTVLNNLSFIAQNDPQKVIIRIPVIPGFNFNENETQFGQTAILLIFELALKLKIKKIHLLPYHTLGKDKYEQMGLAYPFAYDRILSKEALVPLKDTGEKMGLSVGIGG